MRSNADIRTTASFASSGRRVDICRRSSGFCPLAGRVVSAVLPRGLLVVVVRAGLAVVRGAGGPAGEQAQCVVRGGPGLGGVGEQALARFGGDREGLVGEIEVPDDGVVDELDAGGVDPDVVGGPSDPELVAAGGQLPDQVRKRPVAGIAAG